MALTAGADRFAARVKEEEKLLKNRSPYRV